MTRDRQGTGRRGEALAEEALRRRGYAVVAERYRTRRGEIDIVARLADAFVFVEVKARHGCDFGDPVAAVTPQKQRRVAAMAADYLARHGLSEVPCRFDVVGVDLDTDPPAVTIVADAFRPGW